MNAMYVSIIVTVSILIFLWIYLLIVLKSNLFPHTSIELNIIDSKNIVSNHGFDQGMNSANNDVSEKKRKFHVPKFMLELYERNKIGGEKNAKPDVVRSLIPTHGGEIETIDNNKVYDEPADDCHFLIFDIPTITEDEHFLSAELKILTLLDVETRNDIGVRRILKISIFDDTVKRFLDFQEIQLHHLNNSWVSFDVTAPVNDLLHTTSESKILKISITISSFLSRVGDHFKLSLMPPKEDFEHDYPILLLSYSSDKEKTDKLNDKQNVRLEYKRKKRSLEDDYEEETNRIWDDDASNRKIQIRKIKKFRNSCKRKPLYIDFAEIKYDMWIVQPSGYEAYQCQGRCFYPVADHLNPTKHAILQTLLHSVAPSKVSRSCCVPTVLDSISVLYVDTNGVLTYRYSYKDMVVAECGCR